MKPALLLALLFMLPACARAADPCPPARGTAQWSARCLEGEADARRVKPPYLKRLAWNRHGKATIRVDETFELLAVDRTGRVVVPDIRYAGDFDYPNAEHGIGRFTVRDAQGARRCGYFQSGRFTVLVPARYERCQAYHGGTALACQDCTGYCTDEDCHSTVLVGGRGFVLDRRGKVLRTYALPSIDALCGAGKAVVSGTAPPVLRCEPTPDSPFRL